MGSVRREHSPELLRINLIVLSQPVPTLLQP